MFKQFNADTLLISLWSVLSNKSHSQGCPINKHKYTHYWLDKTEVNEPEDLQG